MPLDPRLALMAGQGVTPIDPLAFQRGQQAALQLQSAQRQGQVEQMQLAEAQREERERGTLAQAFRGALVTDPATGETRVDMPRAFSEAYRTTSDPLTVFKAQQAYEKQQAGSAKDTLEARKVQLETAQKRNDYVSQLANGLLAVEEQGGDVQTAYQQTMRQAAQDLGVPQIPGMPPTYDRSVVLQLAAQGQTYNEGIKNQLDRTNQQLREYEIANTTQRTALERRRLDLQERKDLREAAKPDVSPGQKLQDALLARYGSRPAGQGYTQAEMSQAAADVVANERAVSGAQGAEAARIARTDKPLEGEAAKAVAELDTLQKMTDDVTDLFQPGYTGQWEGRWGAVKQWAGNASRREVVFRRIVQDMKDQLLRARSGAAITQQEYERLSQIVPNVTDADETFQAKLLGFRRALDQTKQSRLEAATTGRGPLREQQPGVTPLPGSGGASGAGSPPLPTTKQDALREIADIERQLQGQ
jgi:hypothetical protein